MPTMDEIGRTLPRKSAMMYLASPSGLQYAARHAEHIERCRDRAIQVGLTAEEADALLAEIHREADQLRGEDLLSAEREAAWVDDQYARRLYDAVAALPDGPSL